MSKHCDLYTRERIISLRKAGFSYSHISEVTGVPKSTICDICKKWDTHGSHARAFGSGTTTKLTKEQKKKVVSFSQSNPTNSAKAILGELKNSSNIQVCEQTIRNTLHNNGLFGRIAEVKPLVNKKTMQKRVDLCNTWRYASDEDYKRIVYSDEAPFTLFTANKNQRVWRPVGQRHNIKFTVPMVKHGGGKIMVWGCFSYFGVGKLVKITGHMDKIQYIDILINNLDASFDMMGVENPIFQQDNDPKHTSKYATDFFDMCSFTRLAWPSYSPDLNPIEHLWARIKSQLIGFKAKNEQELFEKIETLWYAIPAEYCQKMCMSMKQRIKDCLDQNGAPTRW